MKIKEGEKIPNSKVFILSKDGPKEISIGEIIGQDKVILFGLPGAFTPTCYFYAHIVFSRVKKLY